MSPEYQDWSNRRGSFVEKLFEKHQRKTHHQGIQQNVINDKQNSYCNLCHIQLKSPRILNDHREKFHTSEAEIATFHLEEVKSSSLKYDCSFCDRKFMAKDFLKRHRTHAHRKELEKSELSCDFCTRVYPWKYRGNLKLHLKTVHKIENCDFSERFMQAPQTNPAENFLNLLNSL